MTQILNSEAVDVSGLIRPGDTVLWGQANAEPLPLTSALMSQRRQIGPFRVMLGISNHRTCLPEHGDTVEFMAYCGAGANRELYRAGMLDILPVHYSQFPELIRSGDLRIDVLMLQLSPADANGRHSLSLAHEYLLPAIDSARVVIAEINQQAPWVYGERTLGMDELDAVLYTDRPLLENGPGRVSEHDSQIARHIAGLVEDGATLQMGIGAIPDAVLAELGGHRHLGVHTGSIGDGVARLMKSGVIDNSRKSRDQGVSVGGVLIGSRLLHEFAHCNPSIWLRSTSYTHDADVLADMDRLVAINSALEVDLTGQVNSEAIGDNYIGAVGGAVDFLRGAQRSWGGLPIIALPSTAKVGSRIVSKLSGPVTVPRCDAGIIVTEYGVADLRGLSLKQRMRKMLDIAHPDFRGQLERESGA